MVHRYTFLKLKKELLEFDKMFRVELYAFGNKMKQEHKPPGFDRLILLFIKSVYVVKKRKKNCIKHNSSQLMI